MLLVGPETSDDAAVYKINDELAMIHTVDFFPPVVDDPYMYGQIAAANALSDVYAMGGVPKLALNVVAFPNCLGPEVLEQILRGGADKVMEAGAVLAGGHTINDKEPKYGLCVTGYVHPDKMWKNYGAEAGDTLILTKPLGCGILNTAIKAEMATQEEIGRVQKIMAKLNKYAAEIASRYTIHSCTEMCIRDRNETSENRQYYQGLPITSMAIILPFLYLMRRYCGLHFLIVIHIAVIIVGLLFILDIKVKKPQNPVRVLLVAVVALALAKMFRLI